MNLLDQLEWEQELVDRGSQQYWNNQDRLRNHNEAEKGDAVRYLLQERMQETADVLQEKTKNKRGHGAKYMRLVESVAQGDYLKLAFIGLQVVFQKTSIPNHNTLLKICIGIGVRIEAELKCQLFEAKYPAYYHTVMKSLREQNVTDYMHKHKVMMTKFKDFDDLEWDAFEPEVHTQLGLRITDAILTAFDDIFFIQKKKKKGGVKTTSYVETTVQYDEWLGEFEKAKGLLSPTKLPLKIPPRPWDKDLQGGYYSPTLSQSAEFIKTKSRDHSDFVSKHDPKEHRTAVNAMQRTPWMINNKVLEVQKEIYAKGLGIGIPSNVKIIPAEFPENLSNMPQERMNAAQRDQLVAWKISAKRSYANEQSRKAEVIAFMQAFRLAKELSDWDEFYYVYTCDFRGRIYCATSGLSPQGADTAKGLLKFGRSEKLGRDGVKWLAIQGANVHGQDKLSYADRVMWIREHEEYIRAVVEDPIGNREVWAAADKPYQFLAFCFEWGECDYGRNLNAHSSIPVGLDGSCNGLQHFSAMLRDEVGAGATNLSSSERPQDIYQEVANKCAETIAEYDDPRADKWCEVGLQRKLAKKPVMTLPYGAKQKSARAAIFEWATDNWHLFNLDEKHTWEFSTWLTPHLWSAIGDTVVAARAAMDWLQKNVGTGYCNWLTPIGFPVYQFYKDVEVTDVRTSLCGITRLFLDDYNNEGTPTLSRQRSGIAPNFVHSIDSTHMVMTINITDFKCYAMIHDDYGTHAGNTEQLFKAIRKSFHTLYTKHDPLLEWAEQVNVDPTSMPEKGTYDINEILEANYFFG